jgi:hypothetical protein
MTGRGTALDIGTFSECTVLTGAGWEGNWGGKLLANGAER